MLLVLKLALDVNKVKYNDKYLCEKIPLMSLSCDLVSVHGPNKSTVFTLLTQYAPLGCMFCFPSVDHVMIFFVCYHYLCIPVYLDMNERKLKEMVVYH